jgi:nucleoside-diphosphate-sugar epimerase
MHVLDNQIYRDDVSAVCQLALPWENWRDATLVLSGASGMIGSFLVDVVMQRNRDAGLNCTVVALGRDEGGLQARFSPYLDDGRLIVKSVDLNTDEVDVPRGDIIIHAASNTHPLAYATDPIGTIMTNVHGTRAMLDLAVRTSARQMCFVSTVEIYGDNRGDKQRFAEHDLGYIDCNTVRAGYPESKRTGEALCQAYAAHHGVKATICRLPRVFGPTMKLSDTKALSQFLLRAVSGQDIVLKSEGNQFFSYLHVADVVGGMLTSLFEGSLGEAYNIAHPSGDVLLKDLAELVARAADTAVVFELPSRMEQRGFSAAALAVLDGTKLAGLGWEPLYGLDEGITRTLGVLREIVSP